jgi:deoxycytidine triphosphate deaminase
MSIKSDKWIRRMAESTNMIEPFEAGQVRERDGQRIVSYGTSSYGYDIRCADEFKIFTNINSTIVDPKISMKNRLSILKVMSALFRQILLRWHEPWSISVFRAMC